MTKSLLKATLILAFALASGGCSTLLVQVGEPPADEPPDDGMEARSGLEKYLPSEWAVGHSVIGMEILAVDGTRVRLRNPYIHRQSVALTVEGTLTGTPCEGYVPEEPVLEFDLMSGSTADIAGSLHDALFSAVLEAQGSFIGSPDLGYCAVHNPNPLTGGRSPAKCKGTGV